MRMSYEDPIRIAQLKLAESRPRPAIRALYRPTTSGKFRLDELIGALPAAVAEPVLDALEWVGWTHKPVSIRFSPKADGAFAGLKIEAALRRWRLFSVRYARERAWVERWLHMIGRSLDKQPRAANAMVQTATMIQGYGDAYRQGLADWHAIIDGLAKPTFEACCRWPISPGPWRRRAPLRCRIRGRSRSSAPSPRSGRVRSLMARRLRRANMRRPRARGDRYAGNGPLKRGVRRLGCATSDCCYGSRRSPGRHQSGFRRFTPT